jgi:hypothetical protein
MRNDNDIYIEFSSILGDLALPGATRVVMRARLNSDSDVCSFEFDSIDSSGQIAWPEPSGNTNAELMRLIVELREWFVSNRLTADHAPWSGCDVSFDVGAQRISVDFVYS